MKFREKVLLPRSISQWIQLDTKHFYPPAKLQEESWLLLDSFLQNAIFKKHDE